MSLVRKLLDRLGAAPRAKGYAELREQGLGESDVLRVARAAVFHPLAELMAPSTRQTAAAESAADELSWLIGRAVSLRHA